nr:MAG TPA: hypothetical protein [Inoviridae sp.]
MSIVIVWARLRAFLWGLWNGMTLPNTKAEHLLRAKTEYPKLEIA